MHRSRTAGDAATLSLISDSVLTNHSSAFNDRRTSAVTELKSTPQLALLMSKKANG